MSREPRLSPEWWERIRPEAQASIRALEARVAALEALVQPLRDQRQQDSHTSSRPPSSDPPQAVATRPRRPPSGRRPGGPPGHEGQRRALGPVDEVNVVIPVTPERCRRCQPPLQGEDPQPQRHQVPEMPPMQPVVTADRVPRLVCPACGDATRAALPAGVSPGGFGPRGQAITALGPGASHLSKRTTQSVLPDRCGVPLCVGTISNLEHATVHALAEPVAEARIDVPAQPAAYLDETGWRAGRPRAWLWTAVTAYVTGFGVRRSRRAKVAQELLGEPCWGWLVTDRWSAYTWYPSWRRQVCWAHLRRDIDALVVRGGRSQEIGEAVQGQARQLFHGWHRVCDGTLAHASFRTSMPPIRWEVERRLEVERRQALWTFVRHEGVEPTNNAAERAIRPGVRWRKGSCGTPRADGSRFVEALMTVAAPLKPPHRHVLDDRTAACEAALSGEPPPSLLPTPQDLTQSMCPAA
jgi:transposase